MYLKNANYHYFITKPLFISNKSTLQQFLFRSGFFFRNSVLLTYNKRKQREKKNITLHAKQCVTFVLLVDFQCFADKFKGLSMMMLLLGEQWICRSRCWRPPGWLLWHLVAFPANDNLQVTVVSIVVSSYFQVGGRRVNVLEHNVELIENRPQDVEQKYQGHGYDVQIPLVHWRWWSEILRHENINK